MKNTIQKIGLILFAVGLGIGAAFGISTIVVGSYDDIGIMQRARIVDGQDYRFEQLPGDGRNRIPFGMFPGSRAFDDNSNFGKRISIEEAQEAAENAIDRAGENLKIAEIMAFENNYYISVIEEDTGRGAFELLVDPYTSRVMFEPGPNMMWNLKYGHMRMRSNEEGDNTISLDEAVTLAQTTLEKEVPGATISPNGTSFYGYYTFDYEDEGEIMGMLSVNGFSGKVWIHNWHGKFIEEKEVE